LLVHPTLVVFEGRTRSANVHIVNRGDQVGTFLVEWSDLAMDERGGLTAVTGASPLWSLRGHARYSPRRVTLKPGETQVVKVAVRRKRDVPEGEYYSHLKVRTLASGGGESGRKNTPGVTVTARTGMAIPVIWRNGKSTPQAVIESARLDQSTRQVVVSVRRVGRLSTRGFLHTYRIGAGSGRSTIAAAMPLVIYPSVERRIVNIPIPTPTVLDNLPAGQVQVVYTPDQAGTAPSLAKFTLQP